MYLTVPLIVALFTYNRSSGGQSYPSGAQKRKQKRIQDQTDKEVLHKIFKLSTYYGTQQPHHEVSALRYGYFYRTTSSPSMYS